MNPLLRLAPLFRPQLRLLAACQLGLLAGTGLNLLGPWLVSRAVDLDIASRDWVGLQSTALLYLAVLLGNLGVTYVSRIGLEITAQGAMFRLKQRLFRHLVHHDLAFHDRHTSGRLITRVQGDTEALKSLFAEVILAVPADLLLLVGMLAVLGHEAPELLPFVAGVLPPYLLLIGWFRRVSPPKFLALRKLFAGWTGFATEQLRVMPTLQLMGRAAWSRAAADVQNQAIRIGERDAHLVPVYYINMVVTVRVLGTAAVLFFGSSAVARGELTVGALLMGLGYLRLMFNPLMRLSFNLTTFERARAAAIRLSELEADRPTITDGPDAAPWPGLNDALCLEDVHFAYDADAPVLQGLNLRIGAGEHVGLVGVTGSGKSTVLNLLLRFREPTAGRVMVDSVDVRTLRIDALRRHLGLVLQDVLLLPGTALDNLGGEPRAAQRALDALGIGLGLDHGIEEGGRNLSKGERQLLTFARALVHDPPVLLLDEATSAVDPATEARVQAALATLQRGRTTLTVAHRLATVRDCHRIVVLDRRGCVAESGTHAQLVELGGLYAAMLQLQEGEAA